MDTDKLIESLAPLAVSYGLRILGVLVLLWVASRIAAWFGRFLASRLENRGVEATLATFLGNLVKYLVLAAAVLSCLGVFGVETTSFAALIGAAGFAVGLAFQGTLSNFSAGVMLIVFRPFKVGDVINAAGQVGKVTDLGLFVTEIDTPDNRRIIVPNKEVASGVIENVSFHPTRRVDIDVGTGYSADLEKTREVLETVAKSLPGRLAEPEPQIVLTGLGDSTVDWQMRVWSQTGDYAVVREAGLVAVKKALDEAGIDIPYPQMVVHKNAA